MSIGGFEIGGGKQVKKWRVEKRSVAKNNLLGLTHLQRITVDLVLSIFSMADAVALTENKRLHVAVEHGLNHSPEKSVPMSVFWLRHSRTLDNWNYSSGSVQKDKNHGHWLFQSTLSLGFLFSSTLVTIVHKVTANKPWLADNLNEVRLYDFNWLLMILSWFNPTIFLFYCTRYVYKEKRLMDMGIELEGSDDLVCHQIYYMSNTSCYLRGWCESWGEMGGILEIEKV